MTLFRRIGSAVLVLCLWVGPGSGDEVKVPTGPVILTVAGLDPAQFPGGTYAFDRDLLAALGRTEITTSSIWTEGRHTYGGVSLKLLAKALNVDGHNLRLHALNDYAIEFPLTEATDEAPILAFEFDGQPMAVRDKGPIWVIYPYDDGPEYRTDTTYSRSIWQLDRIDVLP